MNSTAETPPLLDICGLRVDILTRAGHKQAVADVNLSVFAGDMLAIVGESGSGKTMTTAAVLGLLPRSAARIAAGEIWFDGQDMLVPGKMRRRILRKDIAFITQNSLSSLNPVYTIGRQLTQMVSFRNDVSGKEAKGLAEYWLAKVGITDVRRVLAAYPHNLSGGMRQRVVIAMAISSRPRLIIADEPTTALDTTTQKQVLDLLREINEEFGMAVLIITHDFGVVSYLTQRVAVMYQGRIVEEGGTRQVLTAPRDAYTRSLIAAVPQLDLTSI